MSKRLTKIDVLQAEHDVLNDMTKCMWDCLDKESDLYRVANMIYVDGVVTMTSELLQKIGDDPK